MTEGVEEKAFIYFYVLVTVEFNMQQAYRSHKIWILITQQDVIDLLEHFVASLCFHL